jgi:phenylalanyl-tRNA synthetase beta chain
VLEGLLSQLGVEASYVLSNDESLHPANQAAIMVNGNKVGVVGEVHPKVLAAFEIDEHAYLFEIKVNDLVPFTTGLKRYQPIPRFPAIVRDIALVLDEKVTHQQIREAIKSFPLVTESTVFDVYSGKQVPAGKKSLAYRIVYQSPTQTLTEDEVNSVQDKILMRLNKQFGAVLRT